MPGHCGLQAVGGADAGEAGADDEDVEVLGGHSATLPLVDS